MIFSAFRPTAHLEYALQKGASQAAATGFYRQDAKDAKNDDEAGERRKGTTCDDVLGDLGVLAVGLLG
jgi:hypothetical protein